jgi:3-hydroxyacyl-CoA dehydrogenase
VLATNTSSLPVGSIAEAVADPGRVVGMHFFNPVHAMPLVEIVRGKDTSDAVVAATARLAVKLGKTPVVVKDVAGFLVNRLLGPYLDEAVRLFEAGADPRQLEAAAKQFGMPMGPLELLDEVGFDIASHAGASLHAAYGERAATTGVLARMMEDGRLGKKNRRGFYDHPEVPEGTDPRKAPKKTLSTDLSRFVERDLARGQDFADQWIVDCLVLAMLNEAAHALEEDVVSGPRELDLATVFGMGFPPFRGGLLRYADTLGAGEVVARLNRIASAPDVLRRPGGAARFAPARSLVELAETNTPFHAPR